jgi:hypothetical protein
MICYKSSLNRARTSAYFTAAERIGGGIKVQEVAKANFELFYFIFSFYICVGR